MNAGIRRRWAVGVGLLTAVVVVCFVGHLLLTHGPHASFWPKCLFHRYTGLHCAGCGMTRAAHALVQGDLLMAFRYNPVVMGLFVIGLLALLWELIARWSGKALPYRPRPGLRTALVVLAILLVFWVVRNIAAWPFTLLAPP